METQLADFCLFIDLSENAKTAEVMVEKEDDEKEKVLEMSIDELELSVRSYNCLKRAGINTVEELINKTHREPVCRSYKNPGSAYHSLSPDRHGYSVLPYLLSQRECKWNQQR